MKKTHAIEICYLKSFLKNCILGFSILSPVHVCVGQPLAVTNAEKDSKVTMTFFYSQRR